MRNKSTEAANGVAVERSQQAAGLVSLADQVYEELLDAIVERRLPPGTRLVPSTLARELGVSPTPVKLALERLSADGLVTDRSRRGMFVAQLDSNQIGALFEARLFLETGAARDYFDRVTPEFLDELERLTRAYQELAELGGDHFRRRLGDIDRELHRLIVRLTGNEHIIRWYEQANVHIQGHRLVMPRERYEATINEHRAIVEAFRSGSPEQAVDALRTHLNNARAHLLLMLQIAGTQAPRLRAIRTASRIIPPTPSS